MKRIALLCLGLAFGAVTAAQAQLTMQMSNGWSFTFAGNVNAFFVYENPSDNSSPPSNAIGGILPAGGSGSSNIRTGLLPAFAVFEAKGKEGETDLLVHFGFAPQIQCGTTNSVNSQNHDCFGAQIDMRQVFLTVGGTWGQILAGRELGLYGRQNILTDQTLFGVGATGGNTGQGTTLGRIGFGYIYPQFKAQMTYSSPAGRPTQISIGLFQPATNPPYNQVETPRVEAEFVYSQSNVKAWLGGLAQNNKTGGTSSNSATSWGGSGGIRYGTSTFSVTGSGYYGRGLGTTLLFLDGTDGTSGSGSDGLRKSYGFIGQITVTPPNSKVTLAGDFGSSYLQSSNNEDAASASFKTENTLISGGIYYQATKSLKVVAEGNYAWTKEHEESGVDKNKSFAPAFGLMLFF